MPAAGCNVYADNDDGEESHLSTAVGWTTAPNTLAEDYRREMQAKIHAADYACLRGQVVVTLRVSRQEYRDLIEAYKFLRQINPWMKSVGARLEGLGVKVREALDEAGVE